ncbi:ABC transporter permease [Natrarchaeobius oligotrophus]|uniref:ABC transporter permease n=1 Tax=Natrarchaeobius chitinivorans TaxID=1679083 RepID=A0A3N6MUV9_NATCH|nr:ABC transporter permease [Natrarchaeobius chitinivorans]RQH00092.1 ABC transporter permease [Natrarchaeobius chitinivorans]
MAAEQPHGRLSLLRKRLDERLSSFIRTYKRTSMGRLTLILPALLVVGILIVLPTMILFELSLRPFVDGSIGSYFTFGNYERIFTSEASRTVIFRTIRVALIVTALTLVMGYPLAYTAVRGKKWTGRLIVVATLAPLAVDVVVRTFGWFLLLQEGGVVSQLLLLTGLFSSEPQLLYNETAIIIGLTHVLLPFMVFPLINVLHTIPYSLEEAAQNLGANRVEVFLKVLLPLSLPGIAAGTLMVFAITLASYVTPSLLGGETNVMAVTITDTFIGTGDWPYGSAMAMLLVVIGLGVILCYQRALREMDTKTGGI